MAVDLILKSNIGRALTVEEIDENFSNLEWQLGEIPLFSGAFTQRNRVNDVLNFSLSNFNQSAYYVSVPTLDTWDGYNDFNYTITESGLFKFYSYEAGRIPKVNEVLLYAHYDINVDLTAETPVLTDMTLNSGWYSPSGADGVQGIIEYPLTDYSYEIRDIIIDTEQAESTFVNWRKSNLTKTYKYDHYNLPTGGFDSQMTVTTLDGRIDDMEVTNITSIDLRGTLDIFGDGSGVYHWRAINIPINNYGSTCTDSGVNANHFVCSGGSMIKGEVQSSGIYYETNQQMIWSRDFTIYELSTAQVFPYASSSWTISMVTDNSSQLSIGRFTASVTDSLNFLFTEFGVTIIGNNGAFNTGKISGTSLTMSAVKQYSVSISYDQPTSKLDVYVEGFLEYTTTIALTISATEKLYLGGDAGTNAGFRYGRIRLLNRAITEAEGFRLSNEWELSAEHLPIVDEAYKLYYGGGLIVGYNDVVLPMSKEEITGGLRYSLTSSPVALNVPLNLKIKCKASDGVQNKIKPISIDTDLY